MLPQSMSPESRAGQAGLHELFPEKENGEISVLFIVAHPGDEIIAAGGSLQELGKAYFLHVTNGAPRELETAFAAGFVDRLEFAEARRREFVAALECAGLKEEQAAQLGFAAGEVSRNLATLTMSIATVLREEEPDVVITHPYEGMHPDHDGIAFAVQTACVLLEAHGVKTPVRLEAAGYSDWGREDGMVGEFATPSFTEGAVIQLSKDRRRLKQCMIERMPTRMKIAQKAPLHTESFRVAPMYDFAQAPQEGVLPYEKFGTGLTGNRWRRMAEEALRALGLAGG